MSEEIISISDLCVRAGRRKVLALQNLSIQRGEFVGILGPNGAGKSTLLKACLGLQRGVSGHISVFGHALADLGFRELALLRRRIGYIPQLLPGRMEMPLTVREVVAMGRTAHAGLLRSLTRQDHRLVDEWIERLGLSDLAGQTYGAISGGEQRRTLIARAMVQEPELLLLDEPTANLDLGGRERLVSIVEELYRQNSLTVLLVCHELEVLPACCGRLILLGDGQLTADGSPDQVLSERRVESLYGPSLTVLCRQGRYAIVPAVLSHA
ncbi:MAG: ABC transporter ATP-binding protein [Phycisphaerae bacterium]|jgi:iron complex transport system ATP-binding protein|nr:ABC transporter ATP-binding protein [Phycisphaerae bacterium]HXK87027.1 ABC transporter ATP-binding protein [Phycisphaerae bacterium]